MAGITNTRSKRYLPATLAAGLVVACLGLGAIATAAIAEDHRGGDHRGGDHRGGGERGRGGGGWSGGYYPAPTVVYGSPYGSPYGYPPPVVYGPGIGINLPGVSVGIR